MMMVLDMFQSYAQVFHGRVQLADGKNIPERDVVSFRSNPFHDRLELHTG